MRSCAYRIASNAPPEQSDLCLLCNAAADGVSHVLSGCTCPAIRACHIARHNAAGLLILKALARGSRGGCLWLSDVTSSDRTPEFSYGTRLPDWMLPGVDGLVLRRLRPDALRIGTLSRTAAGPLTRADRSKHVVDIIEVGYCSDTRMAAKIAEKQEQHGQLKRLLLEAGWKGVNLYVFPLGTLGAIHLSALPSLEAFGLARAAATKLLTKLSLHAVYAAQGVVRRKRELEQELWGQPQGHGRRQGVG